MNSNEIMQALAKPFPASDVEWRIQRTNADKTGGLAVPYIDSRAIQRRLDETVGAFNWQNSFTPWQNNAQLCGISLYCEERGEWITKYDGADNSDVEPVKGGLSDACKRAAVQWGIGRFLYAMDGVWVDVEQKGKSVVIKRDQQKKLDDAYNRMLSKSEGSPLPSAPTARKTKEPNPAEKQKPVNPPIGGDKRILSFPPSSPPQRSLGPASRWPELYAVTSAKKSNNGNGVSTTLEMTDPQGKPVRAYLRGEDPALKGGVMLKNLKLIEKKSSYGPYFVVEKYEIAA